MIHTRISSLAAAFPPRVLTNGDLESLVETNDEWIRSRTGICERRIADPGTSTSDLATQAAREALERAGLQPGDLDLILLATITPDHFCMPSTACEVQRKLGAPGVAALDISAACSGFLYGLHLAKSLIATGAHKRILLIGAETLSTITDWTDRSTCVLFSDGAGAAILEASAEPGLQASAIAADGQYGDMLITRRRPDSQSPLRARPHAGEIGFIEMRGNELFKVAVKSMADALTDIMSQAGIGPEDVDLIVPHQANIRIIEAVAKRIGASTDKLMLTVDRLGNNSAATIPIALAEAERTGRLERGDQVLLTAFGGGLTWGGVALRY